jgi:hypothetical protein
MNKKLVSILVASFLAGVAIDFIFNGVLKIVWVAIYSATYLTAAAIHYSYFNERLGNLFAAKAATVFLLGCFASHLWFTGQHETRTYLMKLKNDPRIILQSPELSQSLFIASDRVSTVTSKLDANDSVPVTVDVVKYYGCIFSFKVVTVAGVDVMNDPESSWVWKQLESRPAPSGGFSGLNEENARRLWCTIKWF